MIRALVLLVCLAGGRVAGWQGGRHEFSLPEHIQRWQEADIYTLYSYDICFRKRYSVCANTLHPAMSKTPADRSRLG